MSRFFFAAEVAAKEANVQPSDFLAGDFDIYIVDASASLTDEEVSGLTDFVQNGGGIMVGGQAWSWFNRDKPDDANIGYCNGFPGNK